MSEHMEQADYFSATLLPMARGIYHGVQSISDQLERLVDDGDRHAQTAAGAAVRAKVSAIRNFGSALIEAELLKIYDLAQEFAECPIPGEYRIQARDIAQLLSRDIRHLPTPGYSQPAPSQGWHNEPLGYVTMLCGAAMGRSSKMKTFARWHVRHLLEHRDDRGNPFSPWLIEAQAALNYAARQQVDADANLPWEPIDTHKSEGDTAIWISDELLDLLSDWLGISAVRSDLATTKTTAPADSDI
jgi:hypothetical protein